MIILEMHTNPSGEMFVKNTRSGVTIRISDRGDDILVTASQFLIRPTSVNGLDAFRVSKYVVVKSEQSTNKIDQIIRQTNEHLDQKEKT